MSDTTDDEPDEQQEPEEPRRPGHILRVLSTKPGHRLLQQTACHCDEHDDTHSVYGTP